VRLRRRRFLRVSLGFPWGFPPEAFIASPIPTANLPADQRANLQAPASPRERERANRQTAASWQAARQPQASQPPNGRQLANYLKRAKPTAIRPRAAAKPPAGQASAYIRVRSEVR
jgi:hypothetical protein